MNCFLAATVTLWSEPVATRRITTSVDVNETVRLSGSKPTLTAGAEEDGRVSPDKRLEAVQISFSRTPRQEEELQSLLASQLDPSSALYHQWLSPEDFARRFGMSDDDIDQVKSWLEMQGLMVESVAKSRNRIAFSGTAGQIERAFRTELHYYRAGNKRDYAPMGDLSIPKALSSVVQTVSNLASLRPHSHVQFKAPQLSVKANFTSSQSGNHYLTPKDVATIYDVNAVYQSGYTGAGQSIAVVGQSSVDVRDIQNFRSASGLNAKDPTLVLVPGSGSSTVSSSDEAESDLDLEYAGGIAKDATIYFVYVGSNTNYNVWDAIEYAVDTKIAPIISISYGTCETGLSSSSYATLNGVLAQAAAQGQTIVAASGDSGSTDCYAFTTLTTSQRLALAVDFPASSQYVTGMGGSAFSASDVSSSNTVYWASANGSDVIGSARSYIPENVWNDSSSSNGLSSSGGGISTLTPRPSWQNGVTGITSGSYRLVPDISLSSSPSNAGYLYCSSDTSSTGVSGSCSNGFRDSSRSYLTVAGGTSFAAPVFSGMLALINQRLNSTGQGNINSTLYMLASTASTYASAFHDVTTGNNKCTAGSTYCSSTGASQYSATTGYDEATGLGSVDLYNLLSAWPTTSGSSLESTKTTLSAASGSPSVGASDVITVVVSPQSSSVSTVPTGSISITVDGSSAGPAISLSTGSASYSFSSSSAGTHVVVASYSGDSKFAASTGSLSLTVGSSSGGTSNKTFSLAATSISVKAGSSGTSTVTVTPKNGYTGTVTWSVSASSSIANACYTLDDVKVPDSNSVNGTLTIYTKAADCSSSSASGRGGSTRKVLKATTDGTATLHRSPRLSYYGWTASSTAIALLWLWPFGYRRRVYLLSFLIAAGLSLALAGCGSTSSTQTTSSGNSAKGTYQLVIRGTDTSSSSITASATISLTIN